MKPVEIATYVFISIFLIYLMMNTGMYMMREGMTNISCIDKKCPDGCSKPTRLSGNCNHDGIVKDSDGNCFIRRKCPWECHDAFDECKYDSCCKGCNQPEYFYIPTSCDNYEESDIQHLNDKISKENIITNQDDTKTKEEQELHNKFEQLNKKINKYIKSQINSSTQPRDNEELHHKFEQLNKKINKHIKSQINPSTHSSNNQIPTPIIQSQLYPGNTFTSNPVPQGYYDAISF